MTDQTNDIRYALHEVSASSAGGAPFLIAYGATFLITGLLSFILPRSSAALIAMFQGGVALPIAFWLERKMGSMRMSPTNPLRTLSGQLAMAQALGLPALIVVYSLNPGGVPVVLAALGGVHFFPYAWLHRTRAYLALGGTISIGAFILQVLLGSAAFSVILTFVGLVYGIAAPYLYRHAARLVSGDSI